MGMTIVAALWWQQRPARTWGSPVKHSCRRCNIDVALDAKAEQHRYLTVAQRSRSRAKAGASRRGVVGRWDACLLLLVLDPGASSDVSVAGGRSGCGVCLAALGAAPS